MFEGFAQMLGVDWKVIVGGAPFIIFAINLAKKQIGLKGKQCLFAGLGLSAIIAIIAGTSDWREALAYFVFLSVFSMGGWETLKAAMHKAGTESTTKKEE